ncbi:hypothetical protein CP02DC14_2329, partial [Chlamydia psittaci 02DC14]
HYQLLNILVKQSYLNHLIFWHCYLKLKNKLKIRFL